MKSPATLMERAVVAAPERPIRLAYLDGLRGLAALYVAAYHVLHLHRLNSLPLPPAWARWFSWLDFGPYAVDVFIVLSGYCLMLPLARAQAVSMRNVPGYLARRARRILPAYYAALALSIGCLLTYAVMRRLGLVIMQERPGALAPGVILSHLFLIHNLRFDWVWRLNAPMWSVATEWQIYFLFPLLLLPIRRRFGLAATVLAGFALGVAPHFLLPVRLSGDWAMPWFLGLFAMGMSAAEIVHSGRLSLVRLRDGRAWPVAAAIAAAALVVIVGYRHQLLSELWIADVAAGLSAMSLLIWLGQNGRSRATDALRGLLECGGARRLGAMSYSLYLIHYPLEQVALRLLAKVHAGLPALFLVHLLVVLPLILGAAWLFHCMFERPFVRSAKRPELAARNRAVVVCSHAA